MSTTRIRPVVAGIAALVTLGAGLAGAPTTASATTHPATHIVNHSRHGVMETVTQYGAAPLHAVRSSAVSCSGTPVARLLAKNARGVVGAEIDLYWLPKVSGGTVVACTRHVGPTAHTRLMTSVEVEASKTSASRPMVSIAVVGNYVDHAGPVAIGGLNLKGSAFTVMGGVAGYRIAAQTIVPSLAN